MNYISTIAFKDNIDDYILEFANSKYGIEFSSGGLPHNFNNFKLFESFTGKKIIHNYFPGYKNDPFVLNIASLNEIIKKRSLTHCLRNINKSNDFSTDKFFAVHAGFNLDLNVSDLGHPIKNIKIKNIDLHNQSFHNSLDKLLNLSKEKNINLLIENNVLIKENYNGQDIPFHCVDSQNIIELFEKYSSYNNFGLLLDTAHLKVSCKTLGLNLENEFNNIKKYIKAIHHSDNDGNYDTNSELKDDYWFLDHINGFKNIPNVIEVKKISIDKIYDQFKLLGL
jgi:sugar phosphate isomerase/epimerase